MAKIKLSKETRDRLREFARKVVVPAEEKAAVSLTATHMRDVLCALLEEAATADEMLVLERFHALAQPVHIGVLVGERGYRGVLRDVIQWGHDGRPDEVERKKFTFAVADLPELVADGCRLSRVPKAMRSDLRGWGRNHDLIVYTRLGSELHAAAAALQAAQQAYDAERARRLEVYDKLILAKNNLEDVLEEWPEIRPIYDEVRKEREANLPATLSNTDRSVLEMDMNERAQRATKMES